MRRLAGLGLLGVGLALLAWTALAWSRCRLVEPVVTVQLRDRHGAFLGELAPPDTCLGGWEVGVVPERVAAATLSLEDRRFAQHPGVDFVAVGRAVTQNHRAGRVVSGASTVAMQVARMQDPGPRTLPRKAVEALTALLLVDRYGRDAVLRQYLRLAPYGNNTCGVAYAARRYFDKPVEDLSWAETALLAAVPQAPRDHDPTDPRGLARASARARRILDALLADGRLTPPEHAAALRELGADVRVDRPVRPEDTLHAVLALEPLARSRPDPIFVTSLDLALQRDVAAILRRSVEAWEDRGAGNAAAVVLDLHTLQVLADVGSVTYNDARAGGGIDFSRTPRYPGSTLKPLVYAHAMDRGLLDPGTILDDLQRGPDGIGNADGAFHGPLLPRTALANSRNVPAIELTRRLGLDETWALLARLGLHDDALPASHYGLSLAIGGMPTTPLALARGWAALATDGRLRELQWTADGVAEPGERVFSAGVAGWTAHALSDPMARLPTFPRMGNGELPFPAAFKTGTSPEHRDAWTVAYTPDHLVVVWVGHPDWRPMDGLSGYRAASLLARRILLRLHPDDAQGLADTGFPPPPGWSAAPVCPLSGDLAGEACAQVVTEWFPPGREPHDACRVHQREGDHVVVHLPPRYAAWQVAAGLPGPARAAVPDAGPVALDVVSPVDGARVTRDPDAPAAMSSLRLAVAVSGEVDQVVWYVDGAPYVVVGPPYEARWPLEPGEHTFEAGLPWRPERSGRVRVLAR